MAGPAAVRGATDRHQLQPGRQPSRSGRLASGTPLTQPEDFTTAASSSYPDKWLVVVVFWSKDFTFICPTEIADFGRLTPEFADRDAQVLGVSVVNEFAHHAWRKQHEGLNELPFPIRSDLVQPLTA
jgi:alkyl hydroperoxide reductase subunit AhpC